MVNAQPKAGQHGYITLALMPEDAQLIVQRLENLGIKDAIPAQHLRLVMLYNTQEALSLMPETVHIAFAQGEAQLTGKLPHKQLVLPLQADTVVQRYNVLREEMNKTDEGTIFTPFLTLKNDASAGDLDRIGETLSGMAMRFSNESILL
ncbi:hypothetical protein [Pseudoalteromonas umbrosa]|uniref:hypothetical protein n=1 Tax=Pseudoalteromonas umbrosa TaxID=3048489 RepID=UPI0024C3492A|nr:hypothetical protein [Pseudoalteromonas sp. B95]MDK1290119.1 hypothetical protein [Pseudoalteromonas sp. B95]